MNGRLDVWYRRSEGGDWKKDRVAQISPSWTTPEGYAVFDIALQVDDQATDRPLFFTHSAEDPRSGHDHFGYSLGAVPFKPSASDFEFLGNEISDEQPFTLLLSHPPQYYIYGSRGLIVHSAPAEQDDSVLGKRAEQFDLYEGVINPTGQPIHFTVSEADHVTTAVVGSMLTITYPDSWSGLDRLRLEMTHDTDELTVREFNFMVISDDMNYPDWTAPSSLDYNYSMTIVGTFDESEGINMEDGPMLGVFVNGELTGVSRAREHDGQVFLVTTVYSNDSEAQIDLVGYTVTADEQFPIAQTVTMQNGGSAGMLWNPLNLGAVRTDREVADESIPVELQISSAYPNPASDHVSLELNTQRAGRVSVSVVDMLGRRTMVYSNPHPGTGHHSLSIPLKDYAAGAYRMVVESGDSRTSRSITLVKR